MRVFVKRILLAAIVIVVGYFGVRWAIRALASDETRIRWLVEEMAEGFNDGHVGHAVEGLAEDWSHAGSGIDRKLLRAVLARDVLAARSSRGKRLPYRVVLPEEDLRITVEGDRARVECEAIFHRRRGEEWDAVWHVRLRAELTDDEDGWLIHRTRHDDLVGRGLR